ncbi:adenine phosphoribosyltransferase [Floccifex sp.]|uniref:adenine phosphoribosyltransferase n=1 Tax=Floccifex sp. TaxID=2815810 RepID=UPI002A760FAB|nr:adenine phosphoribosyltransferase [Floccifex sp.]MDD7281540.1 adenine phosphoribosyltransferase [Erysipelotrichaceae bacterium]MDY2957942.1 adenine phosphoribosyltransferase [Floccifex sp.]
MDIKNYIESIPGFPKEGIIFRDVTPILEHPEAYKKVTDELSSFVQSVQADIVIGPEARGFWFGIPVANQLNLPFVPVRKPGKLPRKTIEETYQLEYGTDTLCMHADSLKPGLKVVIIDDLLATGGTVEAIVKLVQKQGAQVVGIGFVVELDDLKGKEKFKDIPVCSLTHFEGE